VIVLGEKDAAFIIPSFNSNNKKLKMRSTLRMLRKQTDYAGKPGTDL